MSNDDLLERFVRAYVAGIVVPTLFLLVIMMAFGYHRYYFEVPKQVVIPVRTTYLAWKHLVGFLNDEVGLA